MNNELRDLMVARITQLIGAHNTIAKSVPKVGPARPLAATEKATNWREITVDGTRFRVLTLEDKK